MENDAFALQNMGRPDDAALLKSRAMDIRGQRRLTPGQIALFFAPGDTNVFTGPYSNGIGDKQAREALPIALHSLSRSGRRRGRQNMGRVGQFMRFPQACRWPDVVAADRRRQHP